MYKSLLLAVGLMLWASYDACSQSRTASALADAPFSGINTGNPRNGSIKHVINGQPGTSPCEGDGTGAWAIKVANVWHCPALSGVGAGSVTSFSAGDLSPLFTTSEATATTTPALTFSLNTQIANRIFASGVSGGAAAPTFRALVAADLPNTAVTPGAYTTADITIDAQGRITAAASGSGGGGGGVSSVTGVTPISSTGGATPAISIANAMADGSTKGASTYTAADFNSSSGLISLDYVNGLSATGSVQGFLAAADWTTFNNKQAGPLTGDVTTSGAAATIANSAVTYAKMQNVSAASRLLGRGDSGSGDVQEIGLGSGLTMTGSVLSASGSGLPSPDTTSLLEDNLDGSKEWRVELGGLTTSTTRVWTAPDANTSIPVFGQTITFAGPTAARSITLPDEAFTVMGLATTQSPTNKTISLATNTVTGTIAQFNTAISDADAATLAGTETLSGKTLTAPKFADLGFIADANGNEMIVFDTVASAVNEVTFVNAATGNAPVIKATGSDAVVNLKLECKGTGCSVIIGDPAGTTSYVDWLASAAPSTPGAGIATSFVGTNKTWKLIDDAGAISTTVRADAGASNNFLTAISADGVISKAQPSAANLSNGVTGSGAVVLANTPTLITPALGAATATSIVVSGSVTADSFIGSGAGGLEITFAEHASSPSTPTSGNIVLYGKADGLLYSKDDAGTETVVSGGGSGGVPTTITVADTTDTTSFVGLFTDATGDLAPKTDAGLTYNAGTGVLTATGFAGPLTGNVTGNVTGSSGSTTGNAATVTTNANLTGHVTSSGNAAVLGSFTLAQLSTAVSDADVAPVASPTFTGTVTIPTPFTLGAVSVLPTGTELNFVDGVTSAIQTQLDAKSPLASPTFTGTVTIPTPFTLGAVSVLPTGTELNFVDGVTSSIQTQLDAKAALVSPSFTTPTLGVATATSINGLTITSSTGTFTLTNAKTLAVTNTLTLSGTDSTVMTFPSATGTVMTVDSTASPTNKSYDAEGTGNLLTQAFKTWFTAAGCNNATASTMWDLGTSLAPTPVCQNSSSGATAQNAALDFPDSDGLFFGQTTMMLPSDFSGAVDAKVRWKAAATSGDVVWLVSTICVADAEVDNPSFNTATTFTADTAKGTTLQSNDASATSITITGCAAGELMHVRIARDRTTSGDTIAGVVSFLGLELTTRRAQ